MTRIKFKDYEDRISKYVFLYKYGHTLIPYRLTSECFYE